LPSGLILIMMGLDNNFDNYNMLGFNKKLCNERNRHGKKTSASFPDFRYKPGARVRFWRSIKHHECNDGDGILIADDIDDDK